MEIKCSSAWWNLALEEIVITSPPPKKEKKATKIVLGLRETEISFESLSSVAVFTSQVELLLFFGVLFSFVQLPVWICMPFKHPHMA